MRILRACKLGEKATMKTQATSKSPASKKGVNLPAGTTRSYQEVIDFLDANWRTNSADARLSCIKKLDAELGSLSQKVPTIFISGTSGKSLTTHFTTRLFQEEGVTVGTLQAPHILTYNERFSINDEIISNKTFTELANTVLDIAAQLKLTPGTLDILVMMSLLYFNENKVTVALIEIGKEGAFHPANVCTPKMLAVTRLVEDAHTAAKKTDIKCIEEALTIVKPGMYVVSADQGKLNLQEMQAVVEKHGGTWVMPIRKLAPLPYPFEQLHGRCAALAERIARIYANNLAPEGVIAEETSLLVQRKGQRGRPTLEAKRQSELHPRRTVEQFWTETVSTLAGHFQLLEKEKPTTLVDNASSLDAFENLFLGIRLVHYQRPLKGVALILASNSPALKQPDFIKLLRYFFKKISGRAIICSTTPSPANKTQEACDAQKITNELRNMKIKAEQSPSLPEALTAAQQMVDERNGLVIVAGSAEILSDYWNHKGIKKV